MTGKSGKADKNEGRDPEIQHAIDRTVAELARRLRPWAAGMADPVAFAERFVADMRAAGWKPPLKPVPSWKHHATQPADPSTAHKGAELARRALAGEDPES